MVEGTLRQQSAQPEREGHAVFLGNLDRETTKETPLDRVSVMGNPVLGRHGLVSSKGTQKTQQIVFFFSF